jgi:hypothetical protein
VSGCCYFIERGLKFYLETNSFNFSVQYRCHEGQFLLKDVALESCIFVSHLSLNRVTRLVAGLWRCCSGANPFRRPTIVKQLVISIRCVHQSMQKPKKMGIFEKSIDANLS